MFVGALVVAACGSDGSSTPSSTATSTTSSVTAPQSTPSTTAASTMVSSTAAVRPVHVVAVGDIACAPGGKLSDVTCQQAATAALAKDADAILLLGDLQYEKGTAQAFAGSFDKSWGALKDRSVPAPGNHEYETKGASGYYEYFGAAAGGKGEGWHSTDRGGWHLVALNSNCDAVLGCGIGSPQEQWLRADLAASKAKCTIAFMHHPRWSAGPHGPNEAVDGLWRALYDGGVDLVLGGHDHDYERLKPLDAQGNVASSGMVSMVVGTGGKSLYPALGSERTAQLVLGTFGVLRLDLFPDHAAFQFVDISGNVRDQGIIPCR